jgi:hypothetical protein
VCVFKACVASSCSSSSCLKNSTGYSIITTKGENIKMYNRSGIKINYPIGRLPFEYNRVEAVNAMI